MKTVGERIRQAREYRGLSAEVLATRVGYKTQSGISNLENRAMGRGGFMLHKIAEELNFSAGWFLNGPDTEDLRNVLPYHESYGNADQIAPPDRKISASPPAEYDPRAAAHNLIDSLSEKGLMHALELLEGLAERHPRNSTERAGVSVPASKKNVA